MFINYVQNLGWICLIIMPTFPPSTNVRFCLTYATTTMNYNLTILLRHSGHEFRNYPHMEFYNLPCNLSLIFHSQLQPGPQKNSRKFGRVSEPINVSQYERLWSLMAPVDISHQARVVKSITWACQFGMIDDFTLNVCPVCQSLPCKLQGISYIWYVAPRL